MTLNVPIRLIWIVRANESSACGPSRPTVRSAMPTPAQLTAPASDSPADSYRRGDVRLGGHVRANELGVGADRSRRSLTAADIDVEADDVRARAGELDRGGPPEPGSRAGDDECSAVDVHGAS